MSRTGSSASDNAEATAVATEIRSPLSGSVVDVVVAVGETVETGAVVAIVESMKMEHEVRAAGRGRVASVRVAAGEAVEEGPAIVVVIDADAAAPEGGRAPAQAATRSESVASPSIRPDLAELDARHALTLDASRPDAVARRHALGLRTARENIADLCDNGSFVEYGALAYAAQATRRSVDELVRLTPADGMVTGIGTVNAKSFGAPRSRAVVMAYDATVLAGTQGMRNHQKTDRLLGVAFAESLPVVLFAEGGGGRPGDVDMPIVAGLHVPTFAALARLSGKVPLVAVVAGRCFAGNAVLAGCCDVVIATRDSSIGLGGPAMIEGGGLGRHAPEAIGPGDVQSRSGVIDVLVADEAEAVAVAKRYLAMFQGRLDAWSTPDVSGLREAIPVQRQRAYDVRVVVDGIFDVGSIVELRAGFGSAVVTALARLEGRPVGVVASQPSHLGGAVDADAADKVARFFQLCDAHGLPVVSLIDTPGFMVGPASEARAHVRHASRLFIVAAQLSVPLVAVVLRKAYGLGAMALAGGSLHAPMATVSWPSGEFGAMGIEGAVDLGYRKELEAAGDGRNALRTRLVAAEYEKGKAISAAATLEIDAVIDPALTRDWIVRVLPDAASTRRSGRFVDAW